MFYVYQVSWWTEQFFIPTFLSDCYKKLSNTLTRDSKQTVKCNSTFFKYIVC